MNPRIYNSVLIIGSIGFIMFLAIASSIQSDDKLKAQKQLDFECRIVSQDRDFIANDQGCYIKHD